MGASPVSTRGLGIPEPPRRDPFDLARRLDPERYAQYLARPNTPYPPVREGDRQTFNVLLDRGPVEVSAVARRVSEHVYWFFDETLSPREGDLDAAVEALETHIWPSVIGLFGEIVTPGVDGDPHLVILHTSLDPGLGGYFSGADAFPKEVMRLSNEREIIYVAGVLQPGSNQYNAVISHELQHAVNFARDSGDEAWLNEGLSELSVVKAGYNAPTYQNYLLEPDTQLNSWPNESNTGSSYGAGLLFTEYLFDQYGGNESISALVDGDQDGLASIGPYLETVGAGVTMLELFRNWTVANVLDEDGTIYGYLNRDLGRVSRRIAIEPREYPDTVNQFGADYWVVTVADDDRVRMSFEGAATARLIPAAAHSGDTCWWGNSGDSIDARLTRAADLSGVESATLSFAAWYETEELWDYAYAEVSVDGGETWILLPGQRTTTRNPNGTGYGVGYSGSSGGWVRDSVDLSPYAGREVLIRFEHITDDAVNVHGICVDDIEIPEIGFSDDAETDGDWVTEGFVRIGPDVPQEWLVTLVRQYEGRPAEVTPVVIENGVGEIVIEPIPREQEVFLVVSAVTQVSIIAADYRLGFEVVARP